MASLSQALSAIELPPKEVIRPEVWLMACWICPQL